MRRLRITTDVYYTGDMLRLSTKTMLQKSLSNAVIQTTAHLDEVKRSLVYLGSDETVGRYEVRRINVHAWEVVDLRTSVTVLEAFDNGVVDPEEIARTMADRLNAKDEGGAP